VTENNVWLYGVCAWCGHARDIRIVLVGKPPEHPWEAVSPLEERTELYCPNEANHRGVDLGVFRQLHG
jgi:hypothetical protein